MKGIKCNSRFAAKTETHLREKTTLKIADEII